MSTQDSKKKYILTYTIVFACIAAVICIFFFVAKRTFVWKSDGFEQHYRAYIYYGNYIRDILSDFFIEHNFHIPRWDFTIGEGADIMSTLNYYVIGDPFTIFAFLFPSKYMYIYYGISIFARVYCSGLAFSAMSFYLGNKNRYGVLAGSVAYMFCYWSLTNIMRHPFFLNPMIYLPLIILGIAMLKKENKFWVLTISVMLAALSNFYFFYMLVILVVIYFVFDEFIFGKNKFAEKIKLSLKVAGYSILGVGMAGVLFAPVIITFFSDSRMGGDTYVPKVYPFMYYSKLPGGFIASGSNYWMYMGMGAIVLLAMILFITKKGYGKLKTLVLLGIVVMLVPELGHILNGFSYVTNRWCFGFVLLCCYILVKMWDDLMSLKAKDAMKILAGLAIYVVVCFICGYSRKVEVFEIIVFAFAALVIMMPFEDRDKYFPMKRKSWAIIIIVMLSVLCSFYNRFAKDDYIAESASKKMIREIFDDETAAVLARAEEEQDESFYRYASNVITQNAGTTAGLSASSYYWTLSNPFVNEFRMAVELPDTNSFDYNGYDDRVILNTLSGVKYFALQRDAQVGSSGGGDGAGDDDTVVSDVKATVTDEGATKPVDETDPNAVEEVPAEKVVPYDYIARKEYLINDNLYEIYLNEDVLPLGVGYNSYILRSQWDKLDALQKQEALMSGIVLDDEDVANDCKISPADIELTSQKMDYVITNSDGFATISDNKIVTTENDAKVTLYFQGLDNTETYLCFNNLKVQESTMYDLYHNPEADPTGERNEEAWKHLSYSKKQKYKSEKYYSIPISNIDVELMGYIGDKELQDRMTINTEAYTYYNGQDNYIVNFNYQRQGLDRIEITFPTKGIYSFDELAVYCQPLDNYSDKVSALQQKGVTDLVVGDDQVNAKYSASGDEYVMFSIPYSDGWKAYVDGVETDIKRADVMYMAVPVSEGEHEIELRYTNVYIKYGMFITLVSVVVFVGLLIFDKRKSIKKV
ncbi:MAG: YfhO family protein [Lachnospiraceae bacterium]|nr:YfhO family protein [Lachnospiraceae bacterium]